MIDRTAAFKRDLTNAVQLTIAHLDSGTVGISADCLWQMVRVPTANAPSGTNAAWVARQAFNEIVRSKPFNRFVYFS